MTEIWKAIPGFEGAYEVSDLGRVRSLDRSWMQVSKHGTMHEHRVRGRVLRPGRMPGGHLSVVLGREHGSICVHAAVMLAFVGPPPSGLEVRHLDGDHTNNAWPENLEYATRERNSQDKKWHNGQSTYKLAPEQIKDIKRRLGPRGMGVVLAVEYGVSQANISRIKRDQIHKDVAA